jgi:hypothetical protein
MKQVILLDDDLTFDNCRNWILEASERVRIEQDGAAGEVSGQALRTSSKPGAKDNKTAHQRTCPHCSKNWHPAERCYKLHPELRPNQRTKPHASQAAKRNVLGSGSAWRAQAKKGVVTTNVTSDAFITFDIDSDASDHFVNTLKGIDNFDSSKSLEVELADGSVMKTEGCGSIVQRLPTVHYAPKFPHSLLSVAKLNDDNKAVLFHPVKGILLLDASRSDNVIARGYRVGDSFKIDVQIPTESATARLTQPHVSTESDIPRPTTVDKIQLLHKRCGHPGFTRMYHSYVNGKATGHLLPNGLSLADFKAAVGDCESCRIAKSVARSHPKRKQPRRNLAPFELIGVDIKGPIEVNSINGDRYLVQIVDSATDMHFGFPIRSRDQELEVLKRFEGQIVRSLGFSIRAIRWDNAPESRSRAVDEWLTSCGIRSQSTDPYSSAMNGAAERAIQTSAAIAKTLRISAGLPKNLWAEMYKTANFLHQYNPTRLSDKDEGAGLTPYERLYKRKPDLSFLRTIGCTCYVHIHKPTRRALDPQAQKGRLIGYITSPPGYRVLLANNSIVNSSHVTFVEQVSPSIRMPFAPSFYDIEGPQDPEYSEWKFVAVPSDSSPLVTTVATPPMPPPPAIRQQEAHVEVEESDDDADPTGTLALEHYLEPALAETAVSNRPRREIRPNSLYTDESWETVASKRRPRANAVKRLTYREAVQDERLRHSMIAELQHLFSGADPPAEIVDLPAGRKPISCTWAHKLKYKPNGEFERAKSRVCPRGYEQVPNTDYNPDEVSAPVISLGVTFLFLNIVAQRRMHRIVVDVDSAFTIPPLKEEVYMKFPPGMTQIPGKAIRLRHSLNGLKQSGFNWHEKAKAHLLSSGFNSSAVDPCFYRRWLSGDLTLIALFVDDFHIAADNESDISILVTGFKEVFPCKTQPGNRYLGMTIDTINDGDLAIGQVSMIDALLELTNMKDCRPVSTPATPGVRLTRLPPGVVSDHSIQNFPYRQALGILLWIARCSRPDIFYAVGQLASHASNYGEHHIQALKRCVRYLHGTKHLRLLIRSGAPQLLLRAYADADFAGEPEENAKPMHSLTGGLIYMLGTGPIFWQSKLQETISKSTAEAEYRATSSIAQQISSYRIILEETGFTQSDPTIIFQDNQACIAMTNSVLCSSKSRHIKLDHHYIRQQVREGEVSLVYCPTEQMIADIFTKALPKPQFEKLRDLLFTAL